MKAVYISIYSVVNSVFFISIMLGIYYLVVTRLDSQRLVNLGHECLIVTFVLIALRSMIWLDSDYFRGVGLSWVLPWIYDGLKYNLYGEVCVADVLLTIWMAGILVYFLRRLWSRHTMHKALWAFPEDDELKSIVRDIAGKLQISHPFRVVRSQYVWSPFIVGIRNPIIVFPVNVHEIEEGKLKLIIQHEIYHYLKKDNLLMVLMEVLSGIYWWNPLMNPVKLKIRMIMELRIDQKVLVESSESERLDYCEILLRLAQNRLNENQYILPFSSSEALKERVSCILVPGKKKPGFAYGTIGLAMLLCVCTLPFTVVPAYAPQEGEYMLDDSNTEIYKRGNAYQVYYDGSLLFETENRESLPPDVPIIED